MCFHRGQIEGQSVCETGWDVMYLHDGVVRRDEDSEQVQVPGGEDEGKQHLGLPRDSFIKREKTSLIPVRSR